MTGIRTNGGEAPALTHASALNDYDLPRIRSDFPILSRQVNGHPLVYLDNAASAQKPRAVIEAMRRVMEEGYANVHRGLHELSARATDAYEAARETVRAFINAGETAEIVFTKGGTEAINLVAASYARALLAPGDEIVLSELEHHSNIVPWQMAAAEKGLVLRVAPIGDDGALDMDAFAALLGPRTRLVAIAHMSNALGTILPVARIAELAHAAGAVVLVDGCQAILHGTVDVRAIGCDFYAFSGHKIYGPTGIGVLYGRRALLERMPPYQGGGDMIHTVSLTQGTTYAGLPAKFEAGTPPIVEAIGLGAALDYVESLGRDRIAAHERDLLDYATRRLGEMPGITLVGQAPQKAGVLSFVMDAAHPHDIGTIVDRSGVAIRAGHHCAQPLMDRLDLPATARASFALYNSRAEIDVLVEAVRGVRELFAP